MHKHKLSYALHFSPFVSVVMWVKGAVVIGSTPRSNECLKMGPVSTHAMMNALRWHYTVDKPKSGSEGEKTTDMAATGPAGLAAKTDWWRACEGPTLTRPLQYLRRR
jgi:hypothetical protein